MIADPPHLVNSVELVAQIHTLNTNGVFEDASLVPLNRYGGKWNSASDPSFIRFADRVNGVLPGNNTTCAPFVTHLLKYTYAWNWYRCTFYDPILRRNKKSSSPYAYQYVALIEQQIGFSAQLTGLNEVEPGDIMAIQYAGGSSSSGHAAVVAEIRWESAKPYPSEHPAANSDFAGATYHEVLVIDCTESDHTSDTRNVEVGGEIVQTQGAGIGVMGVLVDAGFNIVGHTWSLPVSDYETARTGWLNGLHTRLNLQTDRRMVFGRLPSSN